MPSITKKRYEELLEREKHYLLDVQSMIDIKKKKETLEKYKYEADLFIEQLRKKIILSRGQISYLLENIEEIVKQFNKLLWCAGQYRNYLSNIQNTANISSLGCRKKYLSIIGSMAADAYRQINFWGTHESFNRIHEQIKERFSKTASGNVIEDTETGWTGWPMTDVEGVEGSITRGGSSDSNQG